MKKSSPLFLVAACLAAIGVHATTVTSLVGDKDGFGLPGAPAVPADGTGWRSDLGGVFFNDYRDAGDIANAPFTDRWFDGSAISYTHNYSLNGETPISANLAIQFAGVADGRGPWDVLLNGTLIGVIGSFPGATAFEDIRLLNFAVPVGLLTESDGVLLNINRPVTTDGYSINFSELTIETQSSTVPDGGATAALLGLGLAGLACVRRRS